jgi:hypothetical protein
MPERLHRTGALGVDLIQAVHRLVQPDAPFDFPADTVAVGHLPRADSERQVREEETVAFRRVDPDEAEISGVFGLTHMHIRVNGPAVAHEDVFLQEDIEVGPRKELLGRLSTRHQVDRGLPVVFEADDQAHPVVIAGLQPCQAGISEVGEQTAAPPGLVDRQMPAIMLPGRAEVVAHRCPAADRKDRVHFDCRVLPRRVRRRVPSSAWPY